MSLARTSIRRQTRDLEAVHIALLAETEPNTKNTRMALAGNTGSGLRRRAKRAIARAGQLFKPEATVKVIQHVDPCVSLLLSLEEDGVLTDDERDMLEGFRARGAMSTPQTIKGFTKFVPPAVHTIALYMAQKMKNDRIVLDEAQTVGAKS
jgi:hypothetical protein